MLAYRQEADDKILFIMDNASILDHEKVGAAVAAYGNQVGYNSPYSPDMNPIENFFSIWKRRVGAGVNVCKSQQEISNLAYRSSTSISLEDV